MDVKLIFLIPLAIHSTLVCEGAQSRPPKSLSSELRRNLCFEGNLVKIHTDICKVTNGKRQCKAFVTGRQTTDALTKVNFTLVRGKGKENKCIQLDYSGITYSLKVVDETNVVFEEQSNCDETTSNDFVFREKRSHGVFTYKHISATTNQTRYLGVSPNCTDRNLYVTCTKKTEGRFFFRKFS